MRGERWVKGGAVDQHGDRDKSRRTIERYLNPAY
jgi:hypothetical protein